MILHQHTTITPFSFSLSLSISVSFSGSPLSLAHSVSPPEICEYLAFTLLLLFSSCLKGALLVLSDILNNLSLVRLCMKLHPQDQASLMGRRGRAHHQAFLTGRLLGNLCSYQDEITRQWLCCTQPPAVVIATSSRV